MKGQAVFIKGWEIDKLKKLAKIRKWETMNLSELVQNCLNEFIKNSKENI